MQYVYMQMIRIMSKVFPNSVWIGYEREFQIMCQNYPNLPWNIPLPQLYFHQLMKSSPFGVKSGDGQFNIKDRGWEQILLEIWRGSLPGAGS